MIRSDTRYYKPNFLQTWIGNSAEFFYYTSYFLICSLPVIFVPLPY